MTQQCAFHTLTNPFMATTKEYGRSSFSQDVGKKNQQNGWYNRSLIRPKRKDQNVSQNSTQDFGGRVNLFQKKRFPFGKERKKKFFQRFTIRQDQADRKGLFRWGMEKQRKRKPVQALTGVAWLTLANSHLEHRIVPLVQSYTKFKTIQICLTKTISPLGKVEPEWGTKQRKYQRQPFFEATFHILHLLFKGKVTAYLLAYFIKRQLETQRRHRWFLSFFKKTAQAQFYKTKNPLLQGFEIRIEGRLNGRNRSAADTFDIGQVSLQKLSQNVDVSFMKASTKFGSFGIKVWLVHPYYASTTKNKI
jgi:hypothetical protein